MAFARTKPAFVYANGVQSHPACVDQDRVLGGDGKGHLVTRCRNRRNALPGHGAAHYQEILPLHGSASIPHAGLEPLIVQLLRGFFLLTEHLGQHHHACWSPRIMIVEIEAIVRSIWSRSALNMLRVRVGLSPPEMNNAITTSSKNVRKASDIATWVASDVVGQRRSFSLEGPTGPAGPSAVSANRARGATRIGSTSTLFAPGRNAIAFPGSDWRPSSRSPSLRPDRRRSDSPFSDHLPNLA